MGRFSTPRLENFLHKKGGAQTGERNAVALGNGMKTIKKGGNEASKCKKKKKGNWFTFCVHSGIPSPHVVVLSNFNLLPTRPLYGNLFETSLGLHFSALLNCSRYVPAMRRGPHCANVTVAVFSQAHCRPSALHYGSQSRHELSATTQFKSSPLQGSKLVTAHRDIPSIVRFSFSLRNHHRTIQGSTSNSHGAISSYPPASP